MPSKRDLMEKLVTTSDRLVATEDLLEQYGENYFMANERLAQLELAIEDVGWDRIGGSDGRQFGKDALNQMASLALTSYVKNPLTNHSVNVQGHYVFGQGLTIAGESEEVDHLWQLFWDQPANRVELTTPQALFLKNVSLQLDGGLFLALFTTPSTGAVKVRSIFPAEIVDIICNPEDTQEPWYYKRVWSEQRLNERGEWASFKEQVAYYPAWNYRPKTRPTSWFGKPIFWDAPIYHVRTGGTSYMKFGVSEVYPALDWTRAYVKMLENWATVSSTYARFAGQLIVKGGKEGVAAAKAKLNTTFGDTSDAAETNPSPVTGSIAINAEGMARLEMLKTSGMQTPPEEARALAVMAAAGFGIPYSILTGDADKSNLATAKSLDRPTELAMGMRRMLWTTVFTDICSYLVYASVKAPKGVVKGKLTVDEWGTEVVVLKGDVGSSIVVDWPPILEHDVAETMKAIVSAVTLDGKSDAGILDRATVIRQVATALGIENVNEIVEEMVAEYEAAPPAENMEAKDAVIEVLKEVQTALHAKEQTDEDTGRQDYRGAGTHGSD